MLGTVLGWVHCLRDICLLFVVFSFFLLFQVLNILSRYPKCRILGSFKTPYRNKIANDGFSGLSIAHYDYHLAKKLH